MNISSEIWNSSDYLFFKSYSDVSLIVYIICILMTFSINSYVIWLIGTGTGNGLAAEFFILNLCVCEIILCVQSLLVLFNNNLQIFSIGLGFLDGVLIIGHTLFGCLICVERYLAVVHPVTFLKFKPLRYRLMCSAVACLTAFGSGVVTVVALLFHFGFYIVIWMVMSFFFLSIQLYCCLAVLRALKQSGPGERGREREEENHMKKRAFHLILITTVITGIIYCIFFCLLMLLRANYFLPVKMYVGQLCFFSAGLVQPVLFLYRVGKLNFFKCP